MESSSGGHNIPKIMVFHPTWDEFKDFPAYINYMESQGAHKAGIAKIVPPPEFVPRKGGYDDVNYLIPSPITQVVVGCQGLYTQYNIQKKKLTVKEYEKLANSQNYKTPKHDNDDELERKYWKNITYMAPIYGADVCGTLYDDDQNVWNIGRLGTILDCVEEECGTKISGVNTPYLYFGMWKSTFGWHTEDMDLYSINYIHYGAPKTWYGIPPEHGCRLERLAQGFFANSFNACPAFLRHKMTLMSPKILRQYSIPVNKITHRSGEFMVTFPYAYHAGFNHGYNAAESTNFASLRWIEYGKRSRMCKCRSDMVKISMDIFIRRFQPEKYELWKAGKDIGRHPEDDQGKLYNKTEGRKPMEANSTGRVGSRRHPISIKRATNTVKPDEALPDQFLASDSDTSIKQEMSDADTIPLEELAAISSTPSGSDFDEPQFPISEQLAIADAQKIQNSKAWEQLESMKVHSSDPDWQPEETKNAKRKGSKEAATETKKPKKSLETKKSITVVMTTETTPSSTASLANDATNQSVDLTGQLCGTSSSITSLSSSTSSTSSGISSLSSGSVSTSSGTSSTSGSTSNSPGTPTKSKSKGSRKKQTKERYPVLQYSWARSLRKLWPWKRPNFAAEVAYNEKSAQTYPHCSVCSIRTLDSDDETTLMPPPPPIGHSSIPLGVCNPCLPEACFNYNQVKKDKCNLAVRRQTRLLVCEVCRVCVHASCYGVSESVVPGWKCNRCDAAAINATCCLCRLRAGALKPTTCNQWAHIVCAMVIPKITFTNPPKRGQVDISKLTNSQKKLKCSYCFDGKRVGACVICSVAKCNTTMHVTCGVAAGAVITLQSETYPFDIECQSCHKEWLNKEAEEKQKESSSDISDTEHSTVLNLGDIVLARHKKNLRYYRVPIVNISEETFYSVDFEDGSFSNDLYPIDIVCHNSTQHGPPLRGQSVEVLWTDGQSYSASFKEATHHRMYTVKFDDNTESTFKRKNIWHKSEKLPKHISSKISVATERKFDLFYCETVEGARQRKKKCVFELD